MLIFSQNKRRANTNGVLFFTYFCLDLFINIYYLFIHVFGCISSLLQHAVSLVAHVGSSSLTRDRPLAPYIGSVQS